jgi:hypothetical protein
MAAVPGWQIPDKWWWNVGAHNTAVFKPTHRPTIGGARKAEFHVRFVPPCRHGNRLLYGSRNFQWTAAFALERSAAPSVRDWQLFSLLHERDESAIRCG